MSEIIETTQRTAEITALWLPDDSDARSDDTAAQWFESQLPTPREGMKWVFSFEKTSKKEPGKVTRFYREVAE